MSARRARRVLAAILSATYVGSVVVVTELVVPRYAAIVGPVVVVATLPRVSRAARRAMGGDADPFEPLLAVAAALADVRDIDGALQSAADAIRDEIGANVEVRITGDDEPVATARVGDGRAGAVDVRVPIVVHGRAVGELAIDAHRPVAAKVVGALAAQLGPAVRNVAMRRELDETLCARRAVATELTLARQRVVALGDQERRRLERELHDGAQQCLMALVLRLGLAARGATRATPSVDELEQLVAAARSQLLEASSGALGGELSGATLRAAIERLPAPGDLVVDVSGDAASRLTPAVARAVYFTCVEALQNAWKHGGARRVTVVVRTLGRGVEFSVTDDGRGFAPAEAAAGFGLRGMRDRTAALGGRIEIRSPGGRGTAVDGWLPVESVSA